MDQKVFYVYIIQSQKDKSYYIGQTNNLKDRLLRHNTNRSKYSRTKSPWKLIYTESFDTRSKAIKREFEIKNKKNRKYIESLLGA